MAKVEEIYIGAESGEPLQPAKQATAIEGVGLSGDRYAQHQGTLNRSPDDDATQVTLIEAEAIDAALRDFDEDFRAGRSRRNLVTRGIALNDLLGKRFQVGEVILEGAQLCHPCGHLAKLTKTDCRKSLKNRGGLRTIVVKGGAIRVGDAIKVLEGLSNR
jgi:MOSC domain-containing protein YiiM